MPSLLPTLITRLGLKPVAAHNGSQVLAKLLLAFGLGSNNNFRILLTAVAQAPGRQMDPADVDRMHKEQSQPDH